MQALFQVQGPIRREFKGDSTVHIPRIYWAATTPRVLTLERIRGVKINGLSVSGDKEDVRKAFAHQATGVLLKMIFEDGFFHADPHPGNFFMESEGSLGLIDFGMVGHFGLACSLLHETGLVTAGR